MTDRTELRRLLGEAPPLPYRDSPRTHGDPSEGPTYVALEAQLEGRWEEVATGDYDRWSGMGIALAAAAVNALPDLLDQLDAAEAALARVWELHGGWSSQADFNAEIGGDFWRGMTIKGRECADELRRAVDGGEQS